jgi:hypothetical protein
VLRAGGVAVGRCGGGSRIGDAIRGGLERHFGLKLAFQNCHRVAAFRLSAVGGERYRAFVSPRGQLRNQSPELRDC